ncbi:MAG TPA: DUF1345 domain-containing protein, partial [Rhizomicrobium sp.]|nr:DUF1345 domain-containing protein [Rhizomicrobium sp.]
MGKLLQPLVSRPHLTVAIAAGVVLYFIAAHWVTRDITSMLVGWNGGVVVFLGFSVFYMLGADESCMKKRAIGHDEGRHIMLILTVLAAVASVVGLAVELSAAKGQPGGGWRVALAAGTVILSWLFVQVAFAMHYAHVYFLAEDGSPQHQGGLDFGYGEEEPDYWDFLHFAIVIGATSQTADIVFKSREMRRVSTLHSVVAFAFNTAILATM